MDKQKELYQYLEDYHSGNISERTFQERLRHDMGLQEAYELFQQDQNLIGHIAKSELKEIATEALQKHQHKSATFFISKNFLRVVAAGLLIVFSYLTFQYSLSNHKHSPEDIYASYFSAPPPLTERGINEDSRIWQQSMDAYQNKDFQRVIDLLNARLKKPEFSHAEKGKLYLGLSYLMLSEYGKANKSFSKVNKLSPYYQDALWYTALSQLRKGDLKHAEINFQKMAEDSGHFKQKEAAEILLDLETYQEY